MPELHVTQAGIEDLDPLAPLFDAYRGFYGQDSDLAAARRYLHERLSRGESAVFLAWRGEEALGFVQLYPGFSSIDLRQQWTLEDLYVRPKARRQGVAEALMQAARRHAVETGAVRLVLATAHDNLAAQALYERLGYRRDAVFLYYALELS